MKTGFSGSRWRLLSILLVIWNFLGLQNCNNCKTLYCVLLIPIQYLSNHTASKLHVSLLQLMRKLGYSFKVWNRKLCAHFAPTITTIFWIIYSTNPSHYSFKQQTRKRRRQKYNHQRQSVNVFSICL